MSARPTFRRRALRWLGVGAAVVGVALFVVRLTVGWIFPVASISMLPTLAPGEWVFLRWDKTPPRTYELVAFRTGGGEAVVKRVWGAPKDNVSIDPWGNVRHGTGYPSGDGRPSLWVVYDETVDGFDGYWNHGGTVLDPWSHSTLEDGEAVHEVDSREIEGRQDVVLLRYHKPIDDDCYERDGSRGQGTATVQDIGVRVEARALEAVGALRFELLEHGDRFEFSLELGSRPARGVLRQRWGSDQLLELASAEFDVETSEWFEVSLSNVDDRLTARVGSAPPLVHAYTERAENPIRTNGDIQRDVRERVLVGADQARVQFRRLVVERDLHFAPNGPHGTQSVLSLGGDQFYVLGDNPVHSRDSRAMGPIDVERLIGRPTCIVWPPSSWRWLN